MKSSTKPGYRSRVYRGGGWSNVDAAWVRAASRDRIAPADRYVILGFRLTQSGCRQPLKEANPP